MKEPSTGTRHLKAKLAEDEHRMKRLRYQVVRYHGNYCFSVQRYL